MPRRTFVGSLVSRWKAILLLGITFLAALLVYSLFIKQVSADPVPSTIKVIEVRYFPHGQGDVLYHPDGLSTSLQGYLSDASKFHGYSNPSEIPAVDVEVVGVYNRDGVRPNPNGTWQSTYEAILAQDNLCDVITSQGIDQVWLWVDPRPGYDTGPGVEYAISSNYFGANSQNATVASTPFCGGARSFLFMGFDDSRPADLALHSFGHMMEGMLGNLQTTELFWYKFAGNSAQGFPLTERCGNVHFPPNGTVDYDYANLTSVSTFCEDWNPQATGVQTSYDCNRWGCNQEGFLKWWMQNMPNRGNTLTYKGGTLPNWWDFTQNLDQNIEMYAADPSYFIDRNFLGLYACDVSVQTSSSTQNLNVTHDGCGASDSFLASVVSYRAVLNQNTQRINNMTYNGSNMTLGCHNHSNEFVTEVWYYNSPATSGGGTVNMQWSIGAVQDVVAGVKTFPGISEVNPVSAAVCNTDGGNWATNPIGKNPFVNVPSGLGYKVFGGMVTYVANLNVVTFDDPNIIDSWSKKTTNTIALTDEVDALPLTTLAWTGTVNWPWSTAAISMRTTASNVAPVLAAISDQNVVGTGTFTYTAAATDANPGDVLTYSLVNPPANMTINPSSGLISWPTTVGDVGPHVITVKVEDSELLSDTKIFNLQVTTPPFIDFDGRTFVSYAGSEDKVGTVVVSNSGYTVTLTGNIWKAVSYPYTVTANTVLEFDFQSSLIGDAHAIGLDENLNKSANMMFRVYGQENFGINAFNNYASFAPAVHHYTIPVGQYYTGNKVYLALINDHDIKNPTAQSVYTNIYIHE